MNDLVDRLAVEAARPGGRTGDGEPGDLGPADDVGPWAAPDDGGGPGGAGRPTEEPAIAGHPLVVFGHRPTELGGYDGQPARPRPSRDRLAEIVAAKADDAPTTWSWSAGCGSGPRCWGPRRRSSRRRAAGGGAALSRSRVGVAGGEPATLPRRWSTGPGEVIDAAEEGSPRRSSRPGRRWPVVTPGWSATPTRPSWCGTVEDQALGKLVRSLEDRLGDDVWVVDPAEIAGV